MPPTVSPFPSSSARPRRRSGPRATLPTSLIVTGVPRSSVFTTTFSMSAVPLRYPRPRTMYSRPEISMSRPPTSSLLLRSASDTASREMPYAARRFGSTVTWYCRAIPPTVATSATPATDWSW